MARTVCCVALTCLQLVRVLFASVLLCLQAIPVLKEALFRLIQVAVRHTQPSSPFARAVLLAVPFTTSASLLVGCWWQCLSQPAPLSWWAAVGSAFHNQLSLLRVLCCWQCLSQPAPLLVGCCWQYLAHYWVYGQVRTHTHAHARRAHWLTLHLPAPSLLEHMRALPDSFTHVLEPASLAIMRMIYRIALQPSPSRVSALGCLS